MSWTFRHDFLRLRETSDPQVFVPIWRIVEADWHTVDVIRRITDAVGPTAGADLPLKDADPSTVEGNWRSTDTVWHTVDAIWRTVDAD